MDLAAGFGVGSDVVWRPPGGNGVTGAGAFDILRRLTPPLGKPHEAGGKAVRLPPFELQSLSRRQSNLPHIGRDHAGFFLRREVTLPFGGLAIRSISAANAS